MVAIGEKVKQFKEFIDGDVAQEVIKEVTVNIGDYVDSNDHRVLKIARKIVFKFLHIPDELKLFFFDIEFAKIADRLLETAVDKLLFPAQEGNAE